MKIILFFLLLVSTLSIHGQIFTFQHEWFENESFFNDSVIQEQRIAAIHIWQSEKKDGRAFQSERDFLHYEFNRSGKLSASYKSVDLRNKVDTATFLFSYNQKGQLYKQSEQQGPFHFSYFYFYEGNRLFKEVKINVASSSIDTAYLHYLKHNSSKNSTRITTLNALKKPFLYLDKEYDLDHNLIRETKSYHRNRRYQETVYNYNQEQLTRIEKLINGSKQKEISIARNGEQIELVSFIENKNLVKKYAFTYHLNDLPKAIIERNLVEKKIIIYRLEYLFFRN